jgi:hypothetical protein
MIIANHTVTYVCAVLPTTTAIFVVPQLYRAAISRERAILARSRDGALAILVGDASVYAKNRAQ